MKRRKIAVIASSRATYGYKRRLIGMINRSSKLDLQLIVTGMHLMKQYGYSVQEIEADGYGRVATDAVTVCDLLLDGSVKPGTGTIHVFQGSTKRHGAKKTYYDELE